MAAWKLRESYMKRKAISGYMKMKIMWPSKKAIYINMKKYPVYIEEMKMKKHIEEEIQRNTVKAENIQWNVGALFEETLAESWKPEMTAIGYWNTMSREEEMMKENILKSKLAVKKVLLILKISSEISKPARRRNSNEKPGLEELIEWWNHRWRNILSAEKLAAEEGVARNRRGEE